MPTITDGSNATISVGLDDILTVTARGAMVRYENPVGTVVAEFSGERTFGPFAAAASVKLTSVSRDFTYELVDLAAAPTILGSMNWASLPSAALNSGMRVRVADVGVAPGIMVVSNGTRWAPDGPQELARTSVAVSVTGSTSEVAVLTATIPAGLLGINGGVRVTYGCSYTNNANSKTIRLKLGATALRATVRNTSGVDNYTDMVRNRGVVAAQHVMLAMWSGSSIVSSQTTSTVDMTVSNDLVISIQLASAGDTATLEQATVEIFH